MKWESVYIEKVACCGRTVVMAMEFPGEDKEKGPKYGNTTVARHYEPGDHISGRWACEDCPSARVSNRTVFPSTCSRPEAV